MEIIMKQKDAKRILGAAVAAGTLGLALAGCDQIQSLWGTGKDAGPTVAAADTMSQPPQPAVQTVPAVKAAEAPKIAATPPANEDGRLAAKVKSALNGEPALKVLGIDVGASSGIVTLYGAADTRAHREQAAQVASGVAGVKSVKNELVIVAGS
jgi:hyperosmotically inducible protein